MSQCTSYISHTSAFSFARCPYQHAKTNRGRRYKRYKMLAHSSKNSLPSSQTLPPFTVLTLLYLTLLPTAFSTYRLPSPLCATFNCRTTTLFPFPFPAAQLPPFCKPYTHVNILGTVKDHKPSSERVGTWHLQLPVGFGDLPSIVSHLLVRVFRVERSIVWLCMVPLSTRGAQREDFVYSIGNPRPTHARALGHSLCQCWLWPDHQDEY